MRQEISRLEPRFDRSGMWAREVRAFRDGKFTPKAAQSPRRNFRPTGAKWSAWRDDRSNPRFPLRARSDGFGAGGL